eukprot:TRINITY_DN14928_c0_g1_i1.p1 TRINITY_DN14928_c0_g1~~TRINITY_DN14928_c0_g1_i1.p1  ORF type:complete len:397 (+),score=78.25 TRINITY_DN14928_c0_g1_i1:128-1192(+)
MASAASARREEAAMLRKPRERLRSPAFTVGLSAALAIGSLRAAWSAGFSFAQGHHRFLGSAGDERRRPALAATETEMEEQAVWKEAYALEADRNQLLREKLRAVEPEAAILGTDPEECTVDWAANYEAITACNKALEERLERAETTSGDKKEEGSQKTQSIWGSKLPVEAKAKEVAVMGEANQAADAIGRPLRFRVDLPNQADGEEQTQMLEVFRFYGLESNFFSVNAPLPLGLNITKRSSGRLRGAFVVEDVFPGGSAEADGRIQSGDILQSITWCPNTDRTAITDEAGEFLNRMVNNFEKPRQAFMDATYINTVEELVDLLGTNVAIGDSAEVGLVFERAGSDSTSGSAQTS